MIDNRISITKAKARLGELVKRAAYGKERFILEFRDKPQAVIISCEELERLESGEDKKGRQKRVLKELALIREAQARYGRTFDSVKEIRELREKRADELADLRRQQHRPEAGS